MIIIRNETRRPYDIWLLEKEKKVSRWGEQRKVAEGPWDNLSLCEKVC